MVRGCQRQGIKTQRTRNKFGLLKAEKGNPSYNLTATGLIALVMVSVTVAGAAARAPTAATTAALAALVAVAAMPFGLVVGLLLPCRYSSNT
jgi:hypothetical protein